jgi:DNA mismatch endonuclease (patch repair protein)
MRSKHGFETTGERSALMTKIKSGNTKPEIKLRKALFAKGLRFRLNNKSLFGNPDIAIKKYKLVIFIDGEFWHGHNWKEKKLKISANRHYWIPKIERNIARDLLVNEHYNNSGWAIFRFWEKEINKGLEDCVKEIVNYLNKS